MNKAVFLDRDGVLIRERGAYNYLPEHFIINEGVIDALRFLQSKNFLLIVVSNQSGVAKGVYTIDDVEQFHKKLRLIFEENKIIVSEFYYCPHHPDIGLCLCRKPLSLILEKAIARFEINPEKSFLIGDAERDAQAATAVGVKSFLIKPNANLSDEVKSMSF
ncbi:MAG: HAD family hydrolase [Bacteroidia bacterium]|nr:HAD family hydrolase [Bacteroidia bacterium]